MKSDDSNNEAGAEPQPLDYEVPRAFAYEAAAERIRLRRDENASVSDTHSTYLTIFFVLLPISVLIMIGLFFLIAGMCKHSPV